MLTLQTKYAAEIEALKKLLAPLAPGESIDYSALSESVGRDVKGKYRHLLKSACDQLLHERRMAFGAVRNVGIKRMDSEEIVETSAHTLRSIRNKARKDAERYRGCDYQVLSDNAKRMHNGCIAVLASIAYMADPRSLNRVIGHCSNTGPNCLPTAKTLSLLAS